MKMDWSEIRVRDWMLTGSALVVAASVLSVAIMQFAFGCR